MYFGSRSSRCLSSWRSSRLLDGGSRAPPELLVSPRALGCCCPSGSDIGELPEPVMQLNRYLSRYLNQFGVVLIEPRDRGPRPVRCAARHLSVAFLLSLSIGHMKTNFIGFRHYLQARGPWQTQSLIKTQGCYNIARERR